MLPSSPDADSRCRTTAARDSLDRAAQALTAMADGITDDSQYGQRLILNTICGALFHASELLKAPDDEADEPETHEIEVALSPTEKKVLDALAQEAGKPVEEFAARLIMERLKLREVEGFAGELLREQLVNLSKAPA
jgi:hypothetical protein